MLSRCTILALLATVSASPVARARELSPQDIFRRVAPSVVVIEAIGKNEKVVVTGSGVVIPSRDGKTNLIATNCHVTDQADVLVGIKQGDAVGFGYVTNRDAARDLCIVEVAIRGEFDAKTGEYPLKKLPAVEVASSQWLEVGDHVFAVGAPQGLELSLSNGIVSGFRKYEGAEYIQTTAPISKGSSGGGLFDARGRLVGITTMYLKDAQALNFAVPAEWIASVPELKRGTSARSSATAATSDVVSDVANAATAAAAAAAAAEAATATDVAAAEFDRRSRDRWWTFYRSENQEIAFDTETVSWNGRAVTVWERTRYTEPQKSSTGKSFVEDVTRATYYCGSGQSSYEQFTWWNSAGEVVASQQLESWEIKRKAVIPDTVGEAMYKAACDD